MSRKGVERTTSSNSTPGTLTVWQKYCIAGKRLKTNKNFVGCNRLVFCGFLFNTVINFSFVNYLGA